MVVRLLVTHTKEPEYRQEYMFELDEIQIGRLHDNHVPLPDPDLIVGRRHLKLTTEGGFAYVQDDDSKNGTLLNGQMMTRGRKYQLRSGDSMQIGLYHLVTELVPQDGDTGEPAAEASLGDTAVHDTDPNPFSDYVRTMASLLQQIRATYAIASPENRDRQLTDALDRGLANYRDEVVGIEVSKALGMHERVVVVREAGPAPAAGVEVKDHNYLPFTDPDLKNFEEWTTIIRDVAATNREAIYMQRMAIVDDVLLRAVDKMLKVPSRFKLEFLGHSFIPGGSRFPYSTCSVDDLKAHLYDRTVPYEDLRRRLMEFEETVESVMVHEVAMLDGYREGVQHGIQVLMDQLDPHKIKARATQEGAEMRTLGVFSTSKWLRAILATFREFAADDKGIQEKTLFRPGFVRGYLEKVEAHKSGNSGY